MVSYDTILLLLGTAVYSVTDGTSILVDCLHPCGLKFGGSDTGETRHSTAVLCNTIIIMLVLISSCVRCRKCERGSGQTSMKIDEHTAAVYMRTYYIVGMLNEPSARCQYVNKNSRYVRTEGEKGRYLQPP